MSNFNMNWQSDGFTVYALNEQGVNDFSFHVQGNGRNGHDPKTLQKVVSMAEAAPDMYRILKTLLQPYGREDISDEEIEAVLAKADGER